MTKEKLVRHVKEQTELPTAQAELVYEAIVGSMAEALAGGEEVSIRGFGTFSVAQRAGRVGRNPRTGESLTIPAGRKVKFAPGGELKAAVGKGSPSYLTGMERQLGELKKKMEGYKAKSEALGNDAKALYKENAERLSSLMEEARYKFTLLKSGSGGALGELKKGFESAFGELKSAFQRAKDKF